MILIYQRKKENNFKNKEIVLEVNFKKFKLENQYFVEKTIKAQIKKLTKEEENTLNKKYDPDRIPPDFT